MKPDNKKQPSLLFTPIKVNGVTLKNRIGVSPMVTWQAAANGIPNDFHLAHYGSFALGGAGLVMVECTAVEPRGRMASADTGIWNDAQVDAWRRITMLIKSQGSVPGIQLGHAGRKASTTKIVKRSLSDHESGWPTIAPSAIPFGGAIDRVPIEATLEDIDALQQAFVSAAVRSVRAGFEIIELHYGHGTLSNTFLSPISNHRVDRYGGSLANRMRFGLETVRRVRKVIPKSMPLFVRLSVTDYADNGWSVDDSVEFAKQLRAADVDVVDCSSGGVVDGINYTPYNTPDVQHRASARIRSEAGIATTAVGKIVDPLKAEALLRDNSATLVFIGRALLNNPHWPYTAADLLATEHTFKYPDSYDWCIGWKGFYKWRQSLQKDQNNN
ncbi:unnamed protein product [Medioppia subpectinata]|uniref:NADH:flavin oxidoreductase/NADH oxidase N-terminal domain-containing protein n=1 Tax=Medioppia subpectinata TaxID=1979941 RepID=A0A7R9KQ07_9ACAR|nr:unnamed protein product [Medioppia subpectinata]CAG2106290.1 unnamed protein product [Medioppia subpectinata]